MGQTFLGGLGSLGMIGFALVGGSKLFLLVAVGMSLLTVIGALVGRLAARRRSRNVRGQAIERWHAHLGDRVSQALAAGTQQRRWLQAVHPLGAELRARARGAPGLWERHADDDDAWEVCLGTGDVPALVRLSCDTGGDPLAELDLALGKRAADAVAMAAVLTDAPVVHELRPGSVTVVVGSTESSRGLARCMVVQLIAARPPGELSVTVDHGDNGLADWRWLAWSPHDVAAGDSARSGLLVLDRHGVPGPPTSGPVPSPEVAVLLLTDSWAGVPVGASVIDLGALPARAGLGLLRRLSQLSALEAEQVARSLAPRSVLGAQAAGGTSTLQLLGMQHIEPTQVRHGWSSHRGLRIPLGISVDGGVVELDLAESAVGGHGPHGLIIGATGSGKSELLRSLVLALALANPPERLAFVLVDWKGGAAFDDVAELPHVAGLLTNLGEDPRQVERISVSLRAELESRQRVLRAAGAESLAALRSRGGKGPVPPVLLVVLDEFGELLAAEPDVLEVLTMVGRLGRSLGVHLLLSSQRLEEGRLRGLESHLRYRVCLRVQSAMESQAVIGTSAATELPSEPGWGYLAVDGNLRRFRAAHSSGLASTTVRQPAVQQLDLLARQSAVASVGERSERAVAVKAVAALKCRSAVAVWLPPLPRSIPAITSVSGGWQLPIGIADDIAGQAQPTWALDLSPDGAGHVCLMGGPGSGASNFLLAVAAAAVAAQPPELLQLAVCEYGGRLPGLAELPHTRCITGPEHPELTQALVLSLLALMERRGQALRASGCSGWREARAAGRAGPDCADVLLLIDGLARAREDVPDIDGQLAGIAAAGLRVGIHVIVTTQRSAELRPGLRDLLDTRLELRLPDAADSMLSRRDAVRLVGAVPGRMVTTAGLEVQVFAAAELTHWRAGVPAPRLHPLPRQVAPTGDALGIRAGDLEPVRWSGRGHLLVLGDRGSGRSTVLGRLVATACRDPLARRVLIVDPRRALTALAERPGVAWSSGGADTEAAVAELCTTLLGRRDHAAATAESPLYQRTRWWQGPEHLVVVDDADLLPGNSYAGPLQPLAELMRVGPDLGLAVVLARPVTGLARNAFEPVLASLRESADTVLLLRGDPAEGPVVGGLRARSELPPGRGTWITADGAQEIQLVHEVTAVAQPLPAHNWRVA